jgi:hypothetical protein
MVEGLWFSILLGVGIGLVYGLASYLNYHIALGVSKRLFLPLTVGGMMGRMMLCLGALAVVLVFAEVDRQTFLVSFSLTFIIGLALEVLILHRRVRRDTAGDGAPLSDPLTEPGLNESL